MPSSVVVTTEGWEKPVYHAMQDVPTFWGVPMLFFVGDFLLTGFVAVILWWPALLVGAGLYGIAYLGTKIEPHWLGILWEYFSYSTHYEG